MLRSANSAEAIEVNPRDASEAYPACAIAEYLLWLATEMGDEYTVTAGQLAKLAYQGIKEGRWWSEIAYELSLPEPPEWE